MDVAHGHIDVYHNGIRLPYIFQQLHSQGRRITIPKKFVFAASFVNDQPNYNYSTKRRRRKKNVVADIEIRCLDENDMTMFRMILRMAWYVLVPWFVRVNIQIIVFLLVIL